MGEDGFFFLDALDGPEVPQAARALPVIDTLRLTWQRHYEHTPGEAAADGTLLTPRVPFKASGMLPPAAESIESPDDADARYRHKRDTQWTGYMVHISETCEPTAPHLLTHVQTTPATVHEAQCTEPSHQALVAKDLPPSEHLVDAAYIDAAWLVTSREAHGIMLRGPPRPNISWQSHVDGGYTVEHFSIDWEGQQVHCPQGKTLGSWADRVDHTGCPYIQVRFRQQDCRAGEVRAFCPRATRAPRSLKLHAQAQFAALQAARVWNRSEEGPQSDKQRAGVEGTWSQGVRAFGLRHARY